MNTIIFHDYQAQLHRRKHSDARQNASSFCGNIVTAVRVLTRKDKELQRPTEYTMLQDGVLSRATECLLRLRKHSDGRQRACYDCGNIPAGDRIRDAIGRSILTVDRVLATTAETFRRPTECFLRLRKHRNVRQST